MATFTRTVTDEARAHAQRYGTMTGGPYPYRHSAIRCDSCSSFRADGFAADDRAWTPNYGASCEDCGRPC